MKLGAWRHYASYYRGAQWQIVLSVVLAAGQALLVVPLALIREPKGVRSSLRNGREWIGTTLQDLVPDSLL